MKKPTKKQLNEIAGCSMFLMAMANIMIFCFFSMLYYATDYNDIISICLGISAGNVFLFVIIAVYFFQNQIKDVYLK